MRVVIDKATLKRHRACVAAYTSPEWDEATQSLVYADLHRSIRRLLAMGPDGVKHLRWLAGHKLIPIPKDALEAQITVHERSSCRT